MTIKRLLYTVERAGAPPLQWVAKKNVPDHPPARKVFYQREVNGLMPAFPDWTSIEVQLDEEDECASTS